MYGRNRKIYNKNKRDKKINNRDNRAWQLSTIKWFKFWKRVDNRKNERQRNKNLKS